MPITLFWQGGAATVVQVSTGVIASVDATPSNNTFTITLGTASVSVAGVTNAAATAAALVAAANSSTHPNFAAVTWSVPSGANVRGTADTAGLPFYPVLSKSGGGTGTVTNFAITTANAGPNDWSTAANWLTALGTVSAAVPASGDTVILANSSVSIAYGLTTGITGLALLRIEQSYTGKIGLDYKSLATSIDGATVNTSYSEYKPCYLSIEVISLRIGDLPTFGSPSGSSRILIDLGSTTTCTADILNTSASSADTSRPAVRLLGNKSAHILNVRSASGGVGVCAEVPGETSTFGTINIADTTSTSKVYTGFGLTLTTWIQAGGNNVLQSNATITTETIAGGTLRTEGTGAVTTMNSYGGTTNHNSTGTTSTINLQGGNVSGFGSSVARTWSAVNLYPDGTIAYDPSVVTVTAFTGQRRLTLATS